MKVFSIWRCAGSADVYFSVESGKNTNERHSLCDLQWGASISAKGGRTLPGAGLKTAAGTG